MVSSNGVGGGRQLKVQVLRECESPQFPIVVTNMSVAALTYSPNYMHAWRLVRALMTCSTFLATFTTKLLHGHSPKA